MANKITVTSAGTVVNANVTPDSAMYYSNKSKEWATSNKIVDNTDYSSKYYAGESKKQADISTAKTAEVIESGNTAVSNIESAKNNAITDITNQESLSVDNVNTAGATQVSSVNTAGTTQVSNVNTAGTTQINLAKEQVTLATNQANIATEQATIATNKASEVVESGNTALANIDTAKTGAITDITDLKNTSISNITTAKDNAITSITNQETASKTVLIDEGATQIGLIQNEGATQVANVQSTGQTEYNKIITTGIDNKANIDLNNLSNLGIVQCAKYAFSQIHYNPNDFSKIGAYWGVVNLTSGTAALPAGGQWLVFVYKYNASGDASLIGSSFQTGINSGGEVILRAEGDFPHYSAYAIRIREA